MKTLSTLVLTNLCLLSLLSEIKANPISLEFISEIQFADSNSVAWTIELYDEWGYFYDYNLDGWYFASSSDTAYFNPGLTADEAGFILIRQDSLQSFFILNRSGDTLTLYDSSDQWMGEVRYGDVDHPDIAAPSPGQSICRGRGDYSGWYIDNTPTLGTENDYDGSIGTVDGYVYNFAGIPLAGARVVYGFELTLLDDVDTLYAESDSSGHYSFLRAARLNRIFTKLYGFIDQDTLIQIWPDSIRHLDFQLRPTVGIESNPGNQTPGQFNLKQNYPNPFNPITIIEFDLPLESKVTLRILKIDGSELAKLVDQKLDAGNYSITWNASDTPSGIYLYSIEAAQFKRTKKMILLK